MKLEEDLINTNQLIFDKEQEVENAQKELSELKHKQYEIVDKINKQNSINEIQEFVIKNGNILNKKLHNDLRLKLIETLYKERYCISSYDKVLHLILDKLDIKYKYLDEKDGNTKWNLLKIELA